MISKEEVKHIAKLARLGLTEKEIGRFQKELSSILNYIEKLKEVDVSEIEPTSHAFKLENVVREDEVNPKSKIPAQLRLRTNSLAGGQNPKKLLDLAPDGKDGYLKVKSVLENN
ncbi:MAG: Asp-tRNA(Asn)/Glu-tRNA(Gln) amidotransferase subunit GatC [bacterium]